MLDAETLLFFSGHRAALPVYEAFLEKIEKMFPQAGKRVQKTQITFFTRRVFACVSFARVAPKAKQPEGSLVLTLGLARPLDSPRAAVKTEPYPGRWTHHFILRNADDLDADMLCWLREAYAFSERK